MRLDVMACVYKPNPTHSPADYAYMANPENHGTGGFRVRSNQEFESAVEEALATIPSRFTEALSNIAIAWDYEPTANELGGLNCSDGELLGLYTGVPITQRTTSYSGVMPDMITIFKGPHERVCATRQDMVEQIGKTVIHEIGHYFGFDDDYLHAHGY